MKFVVDCQLPPALAHWLRDRGFEAAHVFGLGMGQASDRQISQSCVARDAVLATKDEDFLILARDQATKGGCSGCAWATVERLRCCVLSKSPGPW